MLQPPVAVAVGALAGGLRVTNSFAVTDCGPATDFDTGAASFLAALLLKIEAVTDTGRDDTFGAAAVLLALAITDDDKG